MTSDEEDVDYAIYGHPLDPIEEDSLPQRHRRTEQQIAKDEHGRRRFHGAFTGGFSAGFFNTVGSLEQWKPSSFISSRKSKAEILSQKSEDFMDEEDKGEFGICPMTVKVKPTYENKYPQQNIVTSYGPIPGTPILHELLKPVSETVGIKLLMKMGWKPGQGVGPRVTKTQKRKMKKEHAQRKVYGCSLAHNEVTNKIPVLDDISSDDSDTGFDEIVFAADEYSEYIVNPKQNEFGIGYTGMDRRSILSSKKNELSRLTIGGKTIRGQAFGVGALEEEDEDIYSVEDMTQYDFSLGSGTSDKAKESRNQHYDDGNDGNSIEGFHVARIRLPDKDAFPLVAIPTDFRPIHTARISRFEPSQSSFMKDRRLTHNIEERSVVLSDKLPSVKIKDDECDEESKHFSPNELIRSTTITSYPKLQESDVTFKPFASDVKKQHRYQQYLSFETKEKLRSIQPTSMTEWECDRERIEFERASRFYRPLCADLATRFTAGKQLDDVNSTLQPVNKFEDPDMKIRREAAENEMYGQLTRRTYKWIPCKLMCKRFNVPEPNIDDTLEFTAENTKNTKRKSNIFSILLSDNPFEIENKSHAQDINEANSSNIVYEESEHNTSEVVDTKIIKDTEDTIPNVSNTVDLFKAIFLSSSEDEDNDAEEKECDNINSLPLCTNNERESDDNTVKQTDDKYIKEATCIALSPARGIFANLDLDTLKCHSMPSSSRINEKIKPGTAAENQEKFSTSDISVYGPKLPDTLVTSHSNIKKKSYYENNKTDKKIWVEKSSKHLKKACKHKKKHKKEKRSKHKKKSKKKYK